MLIFKATGVHNSEIKHKLQICAYRRSGHPKEPTWKLAIMVEAFCCTTAGGWGKSPQGASFTDKSLLWDLPRGNERASERSALSNTYKWLYSSVLLYPKSLFWEVSDCLSIVYRFAITKGGPTRAKMRDGRYEIISRREIFNIGKCT